MNTSVTMKCGLISVALALSGCAPSVTNTFLSCDIQVTSALPSIGGKQKQTFEITKSDGKVTTVKSEYRTYTLERTDVRSKENKGPVYAQLILEPGKIILQTEVVEDKKTYRATIYETGKYKDDRLFGWGEGHCVVSQKAF